MFLDQVNMSDFYGCVLKDIQLGEYDLSLFFESMDEIRIQDNWECFDHHGKSVDRSLSSLYRKDFRLKELIGNKLMSSEILLGSINLIFENKYRLVVYAQRELKSTDIFSIYARGNEGGVSI